MTKEHGNKMYHVFTNNKNEYTSSYREAVRLYRQWKREYGDVRLWTMEREGEDWVDGDCLMADGEFPA